jgi:hypothetical protein
MNDEPENLGDEFEQLAEELTAEIRDAIGEAAALSLCFPLTEVGNDSLARLKRYQQENSQVYWQWISETFPEQEAYWKPGLEKAMSSEQPESDDSK